MAKSAKSNKTMAIELRDKLAEFIANGNFKAGDKLPTEAALTAKYGVSRTALREALKLLEQNGTIYVHHGKGRFVGGIAELKVERPITLFESVTALTRGNGYDPTNKVLSIAEQHAPEHIAAALKITADDRVLRLERIRMHRDDVLMYCVDYVPRHLITDKIYDVEWSGSLMDLLETYGHKATMSSATAAAVLLPDDVIAANNLEEFGPAFRIVETVYTAAGEPIVYAEDYHRGDAFEFSFLRS